MRAASASFAGVSVLALLACAGGAAPTATSAPSATTLDGPFVYASVKPDAAALPARFAAPLPARVAEMTAWPDTLPPRAQVHARACAGDAPTWDGLLDGAAAAEAAGDAPDAIVAAWGDLVRWCGQPPVCAVAQDRLTTQRPAGARGVLVGAVLEACPPELARPFLTDPAAPVTAVAGFVSEHGPGADPAWHPRLAEELVRRAGQTPEDTELRSLAMAVGVEDAPAAATALRAAWAKTAPGWGKRGIAAAMYRQSDPDAKAIFAAMCAADHDPMCTHSPTEPAGYATDCAAILAAPAKVSAWEVGGCLTERAGTDWAAARALADALPPEVARQEGVAERIAALHADPGAHAAKLRELGLLVRDPAPGVAPFTPADVLTAAGQLTSFDAETDQYPNEHDALLVELARLGDLGDVHFLEVPPPLAYEGASDVVTQDGKVIVTDAPAPGGVYRLHAYAGGQHWEVLAEDLGDWYDLDAVLGLLNTVARERGVTTRWAALATGDQTAMVVAGPEAGLRAAAAAGILELGGADDARAEGKAFEDEALRKMMEE